LKINVTTIAAKQIVLRPCVLVFFSHRTGVIIGFQMIWFNCGFPRLDNCVAVLPGKPSSYRFIIIGKCIIYGTAQHASRLTLYCTKSFNPEIKGGIINA
jgi:hypothetical protein